MCLSSPDIPPPPPAPQDVKQPEAAVALKKRKPGAGMAGGTLLTSPSGVTQSALTTGAPTLLGG